MKPSAPPPNDRDAYTAADAHEETTARGDTTAVLALAAARASITANDYPAAIEHFTRALAATAPDDDARFTLLLGRADAAQELARADAILADMREAAELVGPHPARRVEVALRVGRAHVLQGRPDEGADVLRAALAATQSDPLPDRLRLTAVLRRAQMLLQRGRAAEALTTARAAVDDPSVSETDAEALRPLADEVIGAATLALGDLDDALATWRTARRRARAAGDAVRDVRAACHVGFVLNQLGVYDEAARLLGEAHDEAARFGFTTHEGFAQHNQGLSYARLGELDRGIELEERALALARAAALPRLEGGARIYLARLLTERDATGDIARALAQLDQVAPIVESFAPMRVMADTARARAHLAMQQFDEAVRHAANAFLLVERLGAVDEGEELARLTYIEALGAAGREREADGILHGARERLLGKSVRIRDEALRRSFTREVPEHRRILVLARERLGPRTDAG